MPTDSATAAGADPLTIIADAMDAAVDAARGRADRAHATIGDLVPATGRLVSQLTYRASYAASYGVVFPAVLCATAIPRGNALVHGLIDGARAAMDRFPVKPARDDLDTEPGDR